MSKAADVALQLRGRGRRLAGEGERRRRRRGKRRRRKRREREMVEEKRSRLLNNYRERHLTWRGRATR
jgi:hypothetical protein